MDETLADEIAWRMWESISGILPGFKDGPCSWCRLAEDDPIRKRMLVEAGNFLERLGLSRNATRSQAIKVLQAGCLYIATHCPTSD